MKEMDSAIIQKEALLLPHIERAILAEKLLNSHEMTSDEIKDSWLQEAENRMTAHRNGGIGVADGAEAISDLKEQFAR